MGKIQANMCIDVFFMYVNIGTCLFTPVFLYFLHLMLPFTPPPHYIIMVKCLLIQFHQNVFTWAERLGCKCDTHMTTLATTNILSPLLAG